MIQTVPFRAVPTPTARTPQAHAEGHRTCPRTPSVIPRANRAEPATLAWAGSAPGHPPEPRRIRRSSHAALPRTNAFTQTIQNRVIADLCDSNINSIRWIAYAQNRVIRHLSNSNCTCINQHKIHDNEQGYPHANNTASSDGTLHAKHMPAHRAPAVIQTYVIAYAYE